MDNNFGDFYPRSPCGERPRQFNGNNGKIKISIHALLAESDNSPALLSNNQNISIHALLAESDVEKVPADVYYQAFLSTLSLRRATTTTITICIVLIFLSTLSLRRATHLILYPKSAPYISIHALLAESDVYITTITICTASFLSTLSLRRATCQWRRSVKLFRQFLSTLSLRRATRLWYFARICCYDFYPRSPCGERHPHKQNKRRYTPYFYPRSPCGERRREQGCHQDY